MHWNYRILSKKISNDVIFEIYRVYYENDIPTLFSEKPIEISIYSSDGDPIKGIKWQIDAIKTASEKSILDYDNFPNEYVVHLRYKKLKAIDELIK